MPIHIDSKEIGFINLNSILHGNDVTNSLPGVYRRMRFHQLYIVYLILLEINKDSVTNINTDNIIKYEISISSCNCADSKY